MKPRMEKGVEVACDPVTVEPLEPPAKAAKVEKEVEDGSLENLFGGTASSTPSPASPPAEDDYGREQRDTRFHFPLARIIATMLMLLPATYALSIRQQSANIGTFLADSCQDNFSVTTACSGTDLLVPVMLLFFQTSARVLSTAEVEISHLWSCENDEYKSRWIRDVMGCSQVFRDIKDIATGKAAAWQHEVATLVSCGLLYACGFSCKSISALNSQRHKFLTCIRSRKGSTGETFWASYLYIRKYLPLWCWFENVARFSGTNLEAVTGLLRGLGYVVIVLLMNLDDHGTKCRRNRVWIIAKLEPDATVAQQEILQQQAHFLEAAIRQKPLPLSDFLSPTVDDAHADRLPRKRKARVQKRSQKVTKPKRSQKVTRPKNQKKAKPRKYESLHDEVWDGERPEIMPEQLQEVAPMLTAREVDVALYDFVVGMKDDDMDDNKPRIMDVSQSIHRFPALTDMCPTITPGGRLLMFHQNKYRLVGGFERLKLQGLDMEHMMPTESMVAAQAFTQKQLHNLAGNAFSGSHVAVVLTVVLASHFLNLLLLFALKS